YSVLDPSPTIDVVGGALHRLVVVAPTTVEPGRPWDALVKAEDVWGNPCERFAGEGLLGADGAGVAGLPERVAFAAGQGAGARLPGLRLAAPGAETRITAAHAGHAASSNIVRALAPGEARTWWGDLHGQTRATVGTGTIEEYFAFGRDVALLD